MSFYDLYQNDDSSSGQRQSILAELVVISQHFLFIALIAFIIDYCAIYLVKAWEYRCAFGYVKVNETCTKARVFLSADSSFDERISDAVDDAQGDSNKALIVITVLALLALLIIIAILCYKKRESLPCLKKSYTFGNTRGTGRGFNSKFNESLADGATGNVGNFSSINNAPARDAIDSDYVIDHVEQAPDTL